MTTSLGSTATVSLTTAFIDLSTFDEIECWLYGGKSVNRFRKIIRKSAWFTVIAAQLNKCGTTGDFNSEMQAMFSRAGDYIRDVWLRVELPEVVSNPGYQARWTRNIGHARGRATGAHALADPRPDPTSSTRRTSSSTTSR